MVVVSVKGNPCVSLLIFCTDMAGHPVSEEHPGADVVLIEASGQNFSLSFMWN